MGDADPKLVAHWVERYGIDEVREWLFEVWNEPNLAAFWTGSQEEYFELYRHTAHAIKASTPAYASAARRLPRTRGSPSSSRSATRQRPARSTSSARTTTRPTRSATSDDTVRSSRTRRRGVMRDARREPRAQAQAQAALLHRVEHLVEPARPAPRRPVRGGVRHADLLEVAGHGPGLQYWTFSDIFEENYFPSVPFHGGFGLLNIDGIPKPVYRAFELLHRLGNERWPVEGAHPTVDVWAVRRRRRRHGSDDQSRAAASTNHPAAGEGDGDKCPPATGRRRRAHRRRPCQPTACLAAMGEPAYPTPLEVEQLKAASQLVKEPISWRYEARAVHLDIVLPPHSVAAITMEC